MSVDLGKKIALQGLWLLAALVPLSLFFTGPTDLARNLDGPGITVPANGRAKIPIAPLPDWYHRVDIRLRVDSNQARIASRTLIWSDNLLHQPFRVIPGELTFRLQTVNPRAPDLELVNPTNQTLMVQKWNLRNYTAINTGFPRFAFLLDRYSFPAFSLLPALLLPLATAFLALAGLIPFNHRPAGQTGRWFFRIQLFSPWFLLLGAAALYLISGHLMISWEAFILIPFPGYLFLGLISRFFREKLLASILVALIIATFLVLLGTVLGVGLPVRNFGPEKIYQSHFTRTAYYSGLAYLLLALTLYGRKKEWFNPDGHLFLSSIWLVFLPSLIIYLANGYSTYGGDTTFNSLLPWRIIQGEGLFFSQEYAAVNGTWGLLPIGDAFLPTFPIGPGFWGLPTALIQYLGSPEPVNKLIAWNQKVTAVWIASLSAAMLFQMLYLLSRKLWLSLLLTAGFALGTTQVTISAATLWQHGPAVFLLCLGLFFLVKGQQEDRSFYPLAALPLAFLPLMRTQAVLFYLAGLVAVGILHPKKLLRFFLWSLPGLGLTLWVNLGLYHSFLGGYSYQAAGDNFATPLLEGAMGSLFSPNRGFLVFSPFLVLGIIGGGMLWAKRSVIAFSFGMASLLYFLVHAKYSHWHGGSCVAPRFTSELIPVLVFFSVYWFLKIKKLIAGLIGGILILISVAISLPGFFFIHEQGQWNVFPDVDRYRQERVWDYRDWLPMHFLHRIDLERFKETPAYAFVGLSLDPLKSKEHHYRVKITLDKSPLEIINLTHIFLKKGNYRIIFKGDGRNSEGAEVHLTLDLVGRKIWETTLPLDRLPSFTLPFSFEVEESGTVHVSLKVSGQGTLVLDTIQIVPAG